MAEKGHALHMETWLTFHVGCIEGMAEKGHTIHENLACFTCWMYSRASNTLYIEAWLALHVECVVQLYTLYIKVTFALHVGCIVQLHTLKLILDGLQCSLLWKVWYHLFAWHLICSHFSFQKRPHFSLFVDDTTHAGYLLSWVWRIVARTLHLWLRTLWQQ